MCIRDSGIKINEQSKNGFYKGVFYKPETIIKIRDNISIFSNKTTHQVRLKIAGSELNIFAEDVDFNNKADERLSCDYNGDDIQIGFNSRFLVEMLSNITSEEISFSFSSPNKAGIIQPVVDKGIIDEETIMLIMPVMLNQ